jgi:uncharacterized protein (DUF4415 family)
MDLQNPPPLTAEQHAELDALKDRPIDFSDIPELDEKFWKNAIRNPFFYRPTKTSTTLRIDSDVLAWLRAMGKGYQSRINFILRREMLTDLRQRSPQKSSPGQAKSRSRAAKTSPARSTSGNAKRGRGLAKSASVRSAQSTPRRSRASK